MRSPCSTRAPARPSDACRSPRRSSATTPCGGRAERPTGGPHPAAERAAALHAAAAAVRDAADELAALNTRETGKPLGDARGGVDAGVGTLVQYAESVRVHRGRSLHGSWDASDFMVPGPRGVVAA